MISQGNVDNLIDALENLQTRMAIGLNMEDPTRERRVALIVQITDITGRTVLQTIQTKVPSSTWTARLKDGDVPVFAPGIPLKTQLRRISAMSQVSSYIFAINHRTDEVVHATFQVQTVTSNTAMDFIVQTYLKNGALVQKEVQIADRSIV